MGNSIAEEVGAALRRVRLARGLSLREVGSRSRGVFTPTAVAGYERAERSISLERFCDLCTFYGVRPEALLAEIMRAARGTDVVDLTKLEEQAPTDA